LTRAQQQKVKPASDGAELMLTRSVAASLVAATGQPAGCV
jgi:hypothetical protein